MKALTSEDLQLRIDDFGAVEGLPSLLRSYLVLLRDFMRQHELKAFIHTRNYF